MSAAAGSPSSPARRPGRHLRVGLAVAVTAALVVTAGILASQRPGRPVASRFSPAQVETGAGERTPLGPARRSRPSASPAGRSPSPTTRAASNSLATPATPSTSVATASPAPGPFTTGSPGSTTPAPGSAGQAQTGGSPSAPAVGPGDRSGRVTVCGTSLCVDGSPWSMYGATVYNPGLVPYRSGLEDPSGTVALAEQAHLDTVRITDFLDVDGDPATAPYDPTVWGEVDAMIAAAGAAGLHVDLGLADYRAMLWNRCTDPYTADWSQFIDFVADRVNTVTHLVYKDDPTIALVSVAGEPLPVGTHAYTASATGLPCSLTYTTADLTSFYAATTAEWEGQGGTVLVNTGGLGYLNESSAGIDWQSIFADPSDAVCDIKTYGGMQAWAPTAAAFCQSIGKPIVDEEFGWTQGVGDAARAQSFATMFAQLRAEHMAGSVFWNLGYQLGPTSYEVNPSTPLTFAQIVQNAP